MKARICRIFKYLVLITIVSFSIFNLVLTLNKDLGRKFLYANQVGYYKGDLFEMSRVLNFKGEITVIPEAKETHTINEAEVITMGDSFFNANYDTEKFPDLLEKLAATKVFKVDRSIIQNYGDNPLRYFKETGYKKGSKKYLVLETVERYAIERSISYMDKSETDSAALRAGQSTAPWYKAIQNFIPLVDLKYFFYNNKYISPINDLGKTIKFNSTKEIDTRTPAYSKDQSNLFYYEDVLFARRQKTDADIEHMAAGVEYLAKELKEKYNIELIYLVIPNKFSIYGDTSNIPVPYDNYIPRFVKELKKRGIKAPDLYTIFKAAATDSKEPLYYKSDTHFGPAGKNLTLEATIKCLNK